MNFSLLAGTLLTFAAWAALLYLLLRKLGRK